MAADLSRLKVGDIIMLNESAYIYNTTNKFASWVYGYKFNVIQIGTSYDSDRIVFGIGTEITGAIRSADIKTVEYQSTEKESVDTKKNKVDPKDYNNKTNVDSTKGGQQTSKSSVDDEDEIQKPTTTSFKGPSNGSTNGTLRDKKYWITLGKKDEDYDGSNDPKLEKPDHNPRYGSPTTPPSIISTKYLNTINRPRYVQSNKSFPVQIASPETSANGIYEWDYSINIDSNNERLNEIRRKHNISTDGRDQAFINTTKMYNRFKIPNPNTQLSRAFGHVFFTRPDLNILTRTSANQFKLTSTVENDTEMYYVFKNNIELLKQLVLDNGMNHNFALVLSNGANSFQLADEPLKSETYGETWTGHKMAYGKHNTEGKIAGTFSISYTDNRDLDMYKLHKIWTDYIAKVYRGQIHSKGQIYDPKSNSWANAVTGLNGESMSYIEDKILDYASSCYYILTAENGEDIIFWSKYYGVFPTNAPSSTFSFAAGSTLSRPTFEIPYQYSFKEDFNPMALVEFNMQSRKELAKYRYINTYDPTVLGTGRTMVGVPFVETVQDKNSTTNSYKFKLRFRLPEDMDAKFMNIDQNKLAKKKGI